MERKNRINNLKKVLEDRKTDYQRQLEAWQEVRRVSKKDGSDFAAKSKNFINAKYEQSYDVYSFQLRINYYDSTGSYRNSTILCYENIDIYCKDERKRNAAVYCDPCSYPKYLLSVDEIFEKIEEKKQWLIEQINKVDFELQEIETTENEANQLLNNVLDFLKKHKNDELQYILQEEIQSKIY